MLLQTYKLLFFSVKHTKIFLDNIHIDFKLYKITKKWSIYDVQPSPQMPYLIWKLQRKWKVSN